MEIDRAGLAEFLRRRRESLQPEDVGLPRGQRRRTSGLRREEVALLSHMSTDYYSRLERERGPHPSEQMIAAIAQGLHLSIEERDHLLRLAGHQPPARHSDGLYVAETLRQTPLGVALTGDLTSFAGPSRSIMYRWFMDPDTRNRYALEDHEFLARLWVSGLRGVATQRGPESRAADIVRRLQEQSAEFRELWERHEVGLRPREVKHFLHPELGELELSCQTLVDPAQGHALLVYTAIPGSETAEKLPLLSVLGAQSLAEFPPFRT